MKEALKGDPDREAILERFHAQDTAEPTDGETFIADARRETQLAKLSRYETTIERSSYKALHELERMQAARKCVGSA